MTARIHAPKGASRGSVGYLSAAQSIPHNTLTEIVLDREMFNSDTFLSSGRLVVPSGLGGRYTLDAVAAFAANGTGERIIEVKVLHPDTTTEVLCRGSDSGYAGTERMIRAGISVELQAGDQVYLEAFQTSGAALNVRGGDLRWTFLSLANY